MSLVSEYKKVMLEKWEEMPQYFITSAENGTGRDEILKFIEEINVKFRHNPKE
jgi:GTP-binding protein